MTLLPQQTLMVDHMRPRPCSAIFAEPGLGKTLAALVWLEELLLNGDITGALIVAPLRVARLTWPMEVEKWCPWMKVADLSTPRGMKAWAEGTAQIYVINYERVPQLCEATKAGPVDTLILDEVHCAKNPSSKRMKPLLAARENFKRVVGMTGTPLANGYMDIFAPFRIIDGGERLGTVFGHFRNRYWDAGYMQWEWKMKDWAAAAIQEKIADITLILKAEEYLNIPAVTVVDVDVPLDSMNMQLYKEFQRDFLVEIEQKELVGVNAAVLVNKLLQFTSGCAYDEVRDIVYIHSFKIEALKKILKEVKEPVLVVTHFIHERDMVLQQIKEAEVFEENSLARWNAGKIKVLVVDPRSAGTGLNMQDGGRHIIWFSQTWSHLSYTQMNARLARTGQTKPVFIHRLLSPGTVDWAVVEALEHKCSEEEGFKTSIQAMRKLL